MAEYRKKLIEVALPLEAISEESSRRKRKAPKGYPTTLHWWYAQRPVAACRAVLFSSLVDDPGSDPAFNSYKGEDREHAVGERRAELFDLIEELVKWENSNNVQIIGAARAEIARSVASWLIEKGEIKKDDRLPNGTTMWDLVVKGAVSLTRLRQGKQSLPNADDVNHFLANYAPPVLDPFAGGGSIPLEAQRLGLRTHASDLNPVAVLINKALIDIPPKFAGMLPVHPNAEKRTKWSGAEGLAEDVRRYAQWMRDEAEKRIGQLYPTVKITREMAKERPDLTPFVGQELMVVAWHWARTVLSPDPSVGSKHVPLISSFWLSTKKGREAYVAPIIDKLGGEYSFQVKTGRPPGDSTPSAGTKLARGASFRCILSGSTIDKAYTRRQFEEHRTGTVLLAATCVAKRHRIHLAPCPEMVAAANVPREESLLTEPMPTDCSDLVSGRGYGFAEWHQLFTPRQLTALSTFAELVGQARSRVLSDTATAGNLPDDSRPLAKGGTGSQAYADAIATYLAFVVSRMVDYNSAFSTWRPKDNAMRSTLGKQAIPMVWDFAEANPFAKSSSGCVAAAEVIADALEKSPACLGAVVKQADARHADSKGLILCCTDPPYYDNVGYADLSDFFFVWLRRSIGEIFPALMATVLTPKSDEIIAASHRHGGDHRAARKFFESRLGEAFGRMVNCSSPIGRMTIFYAYRQKESNKDGEASTGWETFLSALIKQGFAINATWPMRTEGDNRQLGIATNALASSIVLACIPRSTDSPMATRREFGEALRRELPDAIRSMQSGSIAPVDLAQASIGPGMAAFSRYSSSPW